MKKTYEWAKRMALSHIAVIERDPIWGEACKSASQVFYGSWCSGFADNASDVDLVLCVDIDKYNKAFAEAESQGLFVRGEIVRINEGLRDSGIAWMLSVRLRTFEELENELDKDLGVALWMYTESKILSDPDERFKSIIDH